MVDKEKEINKKKISKSKVRRTYMTKGKMDMKRINKGGEGERKE